MAGGGGGYIGYYLFGYSFMREVHVFVIPSNGAKVEVIARMIDKIAGGYTILSAVATHDAVQYILVPVQDTLVKE